MEVEQTALLMLPNGQTMRKIQPLDLEGATNPLDCLASISIVCRVRARLLLLGWCSEGAGRFPLSVTCFFFFGRKASPGVETTFGDSEGLLGLGSFVEPVSGPGEIIAEL